MTLVVQKLVLGAMLVIAVVFLVPLLRTACTAEPRSLPAASREDDVFRLIPIAARDHAYGELQPMRIRSKSDLEKLPAPVQQALSGAKVDLTKEALVLLPHEEGSGSIELTFHSPKLKNGTLVCRISRVVPEVQTADMAYYCYAVAVQPEAVRKVELYVDGGKTIQLSVSPPVGDGSSTENEQQE